MSLEQLFVEPHEFAAISYQLNSSAEIPPLANPLRASSHQFKEESAKKKNSSVARYFGGLKKLNASRCANLSTKGVTHIAKHVTGLDWLDLSWTGVDDTVFEVLVQYCTHLRSIKLFGCQAITHEGKSWSTCSRYAQLTSLQQSTGQNQSEQILTYSQCHNPSIGVSTVKYLSTSCINHHFSCNFCEQLELL